jgi:hypothetical protein
VAQIGGERSRLCDTVTNEWMVMIGSVEWALLEWFVPLSARMQLELTPPVHTLIFALAVAAIGGLFLAAVMIRSRASRVATIRVLPPRLLSNFASRPTAVPPGHSAPIGGSGPRAPSA